MLEIRRTRDLLEEHLRIPGLSSLVLTYFSLDDCTPNQQLGNEGLGEICETQWQDSDHSTDILIGLCEGGHILLVEKMVDTRHIAINKAFYYSCDSLNMALVNRMIQKGANNYEMGLLSACKSGWVELANLMLEKGATSHDLGAYRACESGHLPLVELMIEKGSHEWDANIWNTSLYYACKNNHQSIMKFLINKEASSCLCHRTIAQHLVEEEE